MGRAKQRRFEFTIVEIRTYKVIGEGTSQFEAEQDAIETFKNINFINRVLRLSKVGKPRAVKARELR